MRYIVLLRHLWRIASMQTLTPEAPYPDVYTDTVGFFSDHCVKLYGWMCITFQMFVCSRQQIIELFDLVECGI